MENVKELKYRKFLLAFLILDIIAFSILAFSYFVRNGNAKETEYEDAELVFRDLSDTMVIPSGEPVGIYLKTDGVMVVDTGEVENQQGELCSPCEGIIKTGDYITEINGAEVNSKSELMEELSECKSEFVDITFIRDDVENTVQIEAAETNGTYKLGLWIKDDISGIGTVTFICGNDFMALGHSISDNDTGLMIRSSGGGIYTTHITRINKSFVASPGQLQGTILYKKDLIGIIEGNYSNGIAGYLDEDYIEENYDESEAMYIADSDEVRAGTAYIYSRLEGTLKKYEIEIEKVNYDAENKNLEFRVVDEDLISLTGGVCQGMSGSPIVQDGKLIGAVTHVIVDDPTSGYGVFIENMLTES